jgi:hypothetical protein
MKRILIALLVIAFLLIPAQSVSAAGVSISQTSGDGTWSGDTWSVDIYPNEEKSTTITIYNESHYPADIEVIVNPESFDNGNVTFSLSQSLFSILGRTYAEFTLTIRANAQTAPGVYSSQIEISMQENLPPPYIPPVSVTPVPPAAVEEPVEITFSTDDAGAVVETVVTETETFSLTIEEGTIALDENNEPIEAITITEVTLTDIPENIISVPYEFEPSGATFEPAFELVWTFNPEDITEGETPVVMYFDGEAWIEVDGVVDFDNGTITAYISHFTKFAVFVREVIDRELPEVVEVEPVIEPEVTEPEVDIEITVESVIEDTEPETVPEKTIEPVKVVSHNWIWVAFPVALVIGILLYVFRWKKKLVK